jgi:hypothetical protein
VGNPGASHELRKRHHLSIRSRWHNLISSVRIIDLCRFPRIGSAPPFKNDQSATTDYRVATKNREEKLIMNLPVFILAVMIAIWIWRTA